MMNTYQKLAIVALRVGGCAILVGAFMGALAVALVGVGGSQLVLAIVGIQLLFGILLLLQSTRIGKWIGSDLD